MSEQLKFQLNVRAFLSLYMAGNGRRLKDGTIGDLSLPAWSFKKPQDAALLSLPLTVTFLPRGEEILVGLNPSAHRDELADIGNLKILPKFGGFARIGLDQELRLTLRGTKKAALESCQCWIPGLGKKANSLNEPYTQLSLHYEPHRRSHTGNVFSPSLLSLQGPGREYQVAAAGP